MNAESVKQFTVALDQGEDDSALSLLENGGVKIDSFWVDEVDGVRHPHLIFFLAVLFVRDEVVRALIRLGADINSFRDAGIGGSVTPSFDAIVASNVPALSLCHRLGANLSCAYLTTDSPPKVRSGLQVAIGEAKPDPLIYLLDVICTARPVRLGAGEVETLETLVSRGSPAKVCFEILEDRGFDFKALEELQYEPSDEIPSATYVAAFILPFAQRSGNVELVRYFVKDLGLISTTGQLEDVRDTVDTAFARGHGAGVSAPRADLTKYKCAA